MHVKSAWHRGALSVAMAVGMIFVGISVSPDVHAGTGLASPNCGNGSVRRPVAFRMAGNQLSVSSDPTSVCHGDSVQWDNSANRQSVQVVFDGDPFQNGGTYTVPAGQTLSVDVPQDAAPGNYRYSVCVTSCSAEGTARLDPHIIIMGQ
jgi:plastocyanin